MISLSAIIPVKDEEGSIPQLYEELSSVLKKNTHRYEIIFIDDGSVDKSLKVIEKIKKGDKRVNAISFRGNFGKSAALSAGFEKAKYDTIITLDADLQDDPNEIPKLVKKLSEGYDLVGGWRKNRIDPISKKISSLFFNKGTVIISGVKLHDFNCGLKILKKNVANSLHLHGELHRFIPILAAKMKFKIAEIEVHHRPRQYGMSKFGFGRSWRGIVDLLTTIFITDFATKPAHFFGKIGLIFFLIGVIMDGYVTFLKITTGSTQDKIPLLLAGILFILLGVQLLSTGLIAEMISHYFAKNDRDTTSKLIK